MVTSTVDLALPGSAAGRPLCFSGSWRQEHESVDLHRTKHRADRVTRQVRDKGYKAAVLHSDRSQGQRQRALTASDGRYQL